MVEPQLQDIVLEITLEIIHPPPQKKLSSP